jgi:hypothetical protein
VNRTSIGVVMLQENGSIGGYRSGNELSCAVENSRLVFHDANQRVMTVFDYMQQRGEGLFSRGEFLPLGPGPWHTLTEIGRTVPRGLLDELRTELYGGDSPLLHAKASKQDDGYPHTSC